MANKSYDKAFKRLEEIISLIEGDEISIDKLSKYVEEASGLILVCKEKLHAIEIDIEKSLK